MSSIRTRQPAATAAATSNQTCTPIPSGTLLIPRTPLIAILTLSAALTLTSLAFLTYLLCRHCTRRRASLRARAWGRKSTYRNRISVMKGEVDGEFSRKYRGCLINMHENPELERADQREQPVEMLGWEDRVWEAPAIPAKAVVAGRRDRRSILSFFFDDAVGLWLPKK